MSTHAWDPETYLRFSAPRLRPALDLIDVVRRIEDFAPRSIVDLGCGPGGITRRLAGHWPDAEVVGIDVDAAMLDRAAQGGGDEPVVWRQEDIAGWARDAGPKVDLIYSNAALQWVPDHETLFADLAGRLSAGGVLAVQMPSNFDRPTHTAIADILSEHWPDVTVGYAQMHRLSEQDTYVRWLEAAGCIVDSWKTEYLHILSGPDPVVDWTRGSALGPVLAALPEAAREPFLEDYAVRMRHAYPPLPDGRTLFPFVRLFLVARQATPGRTAS